MTTTTSLGIQQLSLAYFGRPADPASLRAWPATGLSLEAIVLELVRSPEYQAKTLSTTAGQINALYQRMFGREAAAEEVAGWINALNSGAVNHDYLGITMINAGLNLPNTGAAGEMRATLMAKLNAADLFSDALAGDNRLSAAYSTTAALSAGVNFLNRVTASTQANPDQARTAAQLMANVSSAGIFSTVNDRITGTWAEEGYFISGRGFRADGSYFEDEGPFGYMLSDRLPNARYVFDMASYSNKNPMSQRHIFYVDYNKNRELDREDRILGHMVASLSLRESSNNNIPPPFPSDSTNEGSWEIIVTSAGASGRMFMGGFHLFDIQITDQSMFL